MPRPSRREPPLIQAEPPPELRPIRISSTDVEPAQLRGYWQDHLCKHVIQSDCSEPDSHELFFDLLHYPLPRAGLTWLRDSPQFVTRAQHHIRRAAQHNVGILIQHAGETRMSCDGADMLLRPGDVGLVADWRPSLTSATEVVTQSVLMVPLEQMRQLLPRVTELSLLHLEGQHHGTQLVHMVARSLYQQLQSATDLSSVDHFQQALLQAVAGACVAQGKFPPQRGSRLEHYYLEKMEAYIGSHLGSSELSPERIASCVGLSVSHAQRLYREFGMSMSRSIRDKRLAAARQDLLNPLLAHLTVQEIAYKWGFYDAAHFSHAFRKAFELSPKAWREMQSRR